MPMLIQDIEMAAFEKGPATQQYSAGVVGQRFCEAVDEVEDDPGRWSSSTGYMRRQLDSAVAQEL